MARPRKKPLTKDRQVDGAKAPTSGRAEYRIAKVPGLVLRVTATGKKSWAIWLPDGERGRYRLKTFGTHPPLSLSAACHKAQRLKSDVRDGARIFASPPRLLTFAELADEYLKRHAREKKRTADEDERKIRCDLLPAFGSKAAGEVAKADIVRILNAIRDRGAGVAANRTLALVRKIYNWGIKEGLVETNPAPRMEMRVDEEPRKRALSPPEIVSVWAALDGKGFDATTGDALRFQLLTGARIREITSMRVSEITLRESQLVWSLPMGRSKNKCEIVRPLATRAADLILRRTEGKKSDDFVFPSPQDPSKPLAPRSPRQAVVRAAMQELVPSGWSPHDLRRTVATKLASLGVAEGVTKRILGHMPQKRDVLGTVYDQHTYLPQMRSALEAWEARLFDLIEARAVDEVQTKAQAA